MALIGLALADREGQPVTVRYRRDDPQFFVTEP